MSVKTTKLKMANTMQVCASKCDCKILDAALLPSFLYATYQRQCMNDESAGIWKPFFLKKNFWRRKLFLLHFFEILRVVS